MGMRLKFRRRKTISKCFVRSAPRSVCFVRLLPRFVCFAGSVSGSVCFVRWVPWSVCVVSAAPCYECYYEGNRPVCFVRLEPRLFSPKNREWKGDLWKPEESALNYLSLITSHLSFNIMVHINFKYLRASNQMAPSHKITKLFCPSASCIPHLTGHSASWTRSRNASKRSINPIGRGKKIARIIRKTKHAEV